MVNHTTGKSFYSVLVVAVVIVVITSILIVFYNKYAHSSISYSSQQANTSIATNSSISSPSTSNEYLRISGVNRHEYALALKNLKYILNEARKMYTELVEKNEPYMMSLDNFSEIFIEKASIINETTIRIGNESYRYVVFMVYNNKNKFSFSPSRLVVNDIEVRLLPRNKSVTYTGGLPYHYLIKYEDKVCSVKFIEIGFVIATNNLLGSTIKPCNGIYVVRLSVNKGENEVWLVLIKR